MFSTVNSAAFSTYELQALITSKKTQWHDHVYLLLKMYGSRKLLNACSKTASAGKVVRHGKRWNSGHKVLRHFHNYLTLPVFEKNGDFLSYIKLISFRKQCNHVKMDISNGRIAVQRCWMYTVHRNNANYRWDTFVQNMFCIQHRNSCDYISINLCQITEHRALQER